MFLVKHYDDDFDQLTQHSMGRSMSRTRSSTGVSSWANNVKFAKMCSRMEILWKRQTGNFKRRCSPEEKVNRLLPIGLLEILKLHSQCAFPLLRLYCPDKDNTRNYPSVTEKAIAKAYCNVLGLEDWGALANIEEWTSLANMLLNFKDVELVPPDLVGDLSLVVEYVMNQQTKYTESKMTVKDINDLLDELATLNSKNQEFMQDDKENVGPNCITNNFILEDWFRKVIHRKRLSPLEHKWLVRIILKENNFGVRSSNILRAYSPYANGLLAADGSLKSLCDKLAGPYFY